MNLRFHDVSSKQHKVAPHRKSHARLLRSLSVCGVMVMMLGVLAACGGSSTGSTTTSDGKTVITVLDHWPTEPSNTEINTLFSQYEKLHPNITIKRDPVPVGSLNSKIDQEAASHTLPSLISIDNPDMASFAATGILAPLDDYLKSSGISTSDFYAGSLSTMTYNNKTYGYSVGNNDLALYYNKKMFTDAGLKPPTTWSELSSSAKKLTKGDVYGLAMAAPATEEGSWQFEPFFWSNGGDITHVNNTNGVAALQYVSNLVKDGSLSKSSLNWGQADVLTQFQEGHAAMMVNGPWNISLLKGKGIDYGVVSIPASAVGGKSVSPLGGEDWVIPVGDPAKQKAAWDLLNWLEQPTQILAFDEINGYVPPLKSEGVTMLQSHPELAVFTNELNTAHARTAEVGAKYPTISQALWTAEQSALTGSQSPQAALDAAQTKIDATLKK
ncbi:ABC transporter substrate-binding protein [Dictyobacter arantiisoli]|uniref:Sugar ABC transporter substrate-binding protein n=1 Tax=Dictyobacter arantiisoli TaxID=2014874 RepID=A0A5A5TBQ2_9CHLR|nr:ABC transporter substrate-binding protein [Dictyobacter arantiisoli]GCF08920.1 sugar ABC transporter substrate-binding protein [Dictyobacter arantiisoli]